MVVPIRLRPQNFWRKRGKVVYHSYHLRIPYAKRKQGWLGVAKIFTVTHVEGHDQTPHGLSDLAWEAGHKSRQNQKSEVTNFKRLPSQGKGNSGHIQRASVQQYAHQISEFVSLIPRRCNKSGTIHKMVKFAFDSVILAESQPIGGHTEYLVLCGLGVPSLRSLWGVVWNRQLYILRTCCKSCIFLSIFFYSYTFLLQKKNDTTLPQTKK